MVGLVSKCCFNANLIKIRSLLCSQNLTVLYKDCQIFGAKQRSDVNAIVKTHTTDCQYCSVSKAYKANSLTAKYNYIIGIKPTYL